MYNSQLIVISSGSSYYMLYRNVVVSQVKNLTAEYVKSVGHFLNDTQMIYKPFWLNRIGDEWYLGVKETDEHDLFYLVHNQYWDEKAKINLKQYLE